ncbi:hypothetical protein MnTg02_02644 [bacterium MnTg02]|nr:hypothetical protein MnTg02_02644 [bacterium MnTg02]
MPAKHRIIILGAGFSRPAGFPLAPDLWQEIRKLSAHLTGRAAKFNHDLEAYIEYRRDCDGLDLTSETVDFEDFMKFLDIEHFLSLRGKDTWSDEGNEGTIVTKFLIGKILARYVNAHPQVPELYLEFARRLEPRDLVITFNYDTLLERSLEAVSKPYRLFSTRYKSLTNHGGIVDSDRDEVVVLKVHGSIDWFDRTRFERNLDNHAEQGAPPPTDIIFSDEKTLDLQLLVDGPRPTGDPLKNVYRAKNLAALYNKDLLFLATPRILPPSAAKLVYSPGMNDFWSDISGHGINNFGMSIVGFSLPPQDDYTRQIVYSLVTNYQKANWGADELGRTKPPLAIVDFFGDSKKAEANFRNRYRFVDWSRATLFGTGFDAKILDSIFA